MKKFATLFVVILSVVFAASTVLAAAPEKVTFKAEKGNVTFDHKGHAAKIAKCAECHHKDEAGKEQKCDKCHAKGKGEGKKVELKEALHKNCKDCHKAGKKGPEKCDGCHKK
jgi:uncharacterized paraquat-inducible protein A